MSSTQEIPTKKTEIPEIKITLGNLPAELTSLFQSDTPVTKAEFKKLQIQFLMKYHPDRFKGDVTAKKANEEFFKKLNPWLKSQLKKFDNPQTTQRAPVDVDRDQRTADAQQSMNNQFSEMAIDINKNVFLVDIKYSLGLFSIQYSTNTQSMPEVLAQMKQSGYTDQLITVSYISD